MPAPKRPRREPTDAWEQLRLYITCPVQERYEVLRPIVLFGATPAERARQTGVPERTLRRQADHFDARGIASLFEEPAAPAADRRALPAEIRRAIIELRAEYAGLTAHEIAGICAQRFRRPVSRNTVVRVLAAGPLPSSQPRRFPHYRDIADSVARRLAVVRLYVEGWTITSIAGYLATPRPNVYAVLRRWFDEGVPGLEDHASTPQHPKRKANLKVLAAVRRLMANPELGGFRVSAALAVEGIYLSERTCRRLLALHRALGAAQRPAAEAREPQPHPFAATRRHQVWSVDIRYIEDHGLPTDKPAYVVAVLDNFSRAMLASLLSPRQDLTAYLVVLRAAIERHGAPEVLVSDSGAVFLANQAQRIYAALGIDKREIERGRPWQNYIEANFGTMRRMADYHFARATTWAELHAVHERFVHDYNEQPHWAHRERADGRRSPQAVLGPLRTAWCDPADLDRLFRVRAARRVDAGGYVRYVHWRLYGERGLAGAQAAVWVLGETVTVEYGTDALAQYQVTFEPDERHIRGVDEARLFESRYPSPQPFLPALEAVPWHPARRLSIPSVRRRLAPPFAVQPALFTLAAAEQATG